MRIAVVTWYPHWHEWNKTSYATVVMGTVAVATKCIRRRHASQDYICIEYLPTHGHITSAKRRRRRRKATFLKNRLHLHLYAVGITVRVSTHLLRHSTMRLSRATNLSTANSNLYSSTNRDVYMMRHRRSGRVWDDRCRPEHDGGNGKRLTPSCSH